MRIDNKTKSIIDDIESGKLNKYLKQIDNSDFGFYIPVFEDNGIIKPMREGYSQTERNLVISVEKKDTHVMDIKNNDKKPTVQTKGHNPTTIRGGKAHNLTAALERKAKELEPALPVGWFGNLKAKNSSCTHGSVDKCKHCTGHTGACRHCTHCARHSDHDISDLLGVHMKELDYHKVVKEIDNKQELLNALAVHGVGLTLLHAHSDQFMFTELPEGYVSVIANGVTTFRKESDVAKDKTFVPNAWRSIDGKLQVAGGFSGIDLEKTNKLRPVHKFQRPI